MSFLYQSRIRPTNGEINVIPFSAHAIAWCKPKINVRLVAIPSFSRTAAAWIPSQVAAILIKILSFEIPAASYCAIISRPFVTVASVSKDKRASTSVETRPGIISRILRPKETAKRSNAKVTTSAADALAPKVSLAPFKVSSTIP